MAFDGTYQCPICNHITHSKVSDAECQVDCSNCDCTLIFVTPSTCRYCGYSRKFKCLALPRVVFVELEDGQFGTTRIYFGYSE